MGRPSLVPSRLTSVFALLTSVVAVAAASLAAAGPAAADVVAVKGSAYGFFTNVSLFGGPSSTHGPTPSVSLPAAGSAAPIVETAPEGGKGQYGPAVVFGGIWPDSAPSGGPSGPITVRTQGTLGPNGSSTSSVDIVLYDPPRPNGPGGIGPGPLIADEAHSTCTVTESGLSGSSRFVNGKVETKYDKDTQLPIPEFVRPIPVNPPVNQEYTGTIDHVGDHFRIVLNEQIPGPDGSLTVNAAHMFLLGPIAVGEMIVGQSVCGVTGGPASGPPPAAPEGTRAPDTTPAATATTAASNTVPPLAISTSVAPSTTIGLSFDSRSGAPGGTLPPLVGDAGTPTTRRGDESASAARSGSNEGGSGFPVLFLVVAVGAGVATALVVARRRRLE